MALYGAAKAPAVEKNDDGTTQGTLTDNSGGTSGGDTIAAITDAGTGEAELVSTQNAIATLAAKVNSLIDHMNDGRV